MVIDLPSSLPIVCLEVEPRCMLCNAILWYYNTLGSESESESESQIVYSIDMHRIHLQIKLHNTITHTHTCKSVVIYGESTMSPKIEGRQPDSSVVTDGNPSCHKTTQRGCCWWLLLVAWCLLCARTSATTLKTWVGLPGHIKGTVIYGEKYHGPSAW